MKKKPIKTRPKPKKSTDQIAYLYGVVVDLQTEMRAGFARMDTQFDEVRKNFWRVFEDVSALQAEVRSIRKDLDRLTDQVQGMRGYSTEIDGLYTRIAAIEKHLGLQTA